MIVYLRSIYDITIQISIRYWWYVWYNLEWGLRWKICTINLIIKVETVMKDNSSNLCTSIAYEWVESHPN